MSEYNYADFPLDTDREAFVGFPDALTVGQSAPDGELVDAADGRRVRLSDYWRTGPLMIEFGSVT